jgi:hypothetical protein
LHGLERLACDRQPQGPAEPVAAVAQSIGKDPAALLVRVSGVRYEIYPGVFRGAAATLADGAGNDYDRAVLLHAHRRARPKFGTPIPAFRRLRAFPGCRAR